MTQTILTLVSFAIMQIQAADGSIHERSGYETTKQVGNIAGGGLRVTFTTTDKSTGEQCIFTSTYTKGYHGFEPYETSFDHKSTLHSAHMINISLINLAILKTIAPEKVDEFLTVQAACYKPAVDVIPDPVTFLLAEQDDKKNQSTKI